MEYKEYNSMTNFRAIATEMLSGIVFKERILSYKALLEFMQSGEKYNRAVKCGLIPNLDLDEIDYIVTSITLNKKKILNRYRQEINIYSYLDLSKHYYVSRKAGELFKINFVNSYEEIKNYNYMTGHNINNKIVLLERADNNEKNLYIYNGDNFISTYGTLVFVEPIKNNINQISYNKLPLQSIYKLIQNTEIINNKLCIDARAYS